MKEPGVGQVTMKQKEESHLTAKYQEYKKLNVSDLLYPQFWSIQRKKIFILHYSVSYMPSGKTRYLQAQFQKCLNKALINAVISCIFFLLHMF